VIEWGTCAQQRVAVATLASLPDVIAAEGLQAPAVIVIGETVRLRSVLDWLDASGPDPCSGQATDGTRRSLGASPSPVAVDADGAIALAIS
jgi:hypothetical protein